MANEKKAYFKRSWGLLKAQKGWWKVLLVMAAANLVPIVGYFGTRGYITEWARMTAWGVDTAPKQKKVKVGACIKKGVQSTFAMALWWLAACLIGFLIYKLPLSTIISTIFGCFTLILYWMSSLLASIYQKVTAGYNVKRLIDLVKYDSSGFISLFWISLALNLIGGVIVVVCALAAFGPVIFSLVSAMVAYGDASAAAPFVISTLSSVLNTLVVGAVVFALIWGLYQVYSDCIMANAVALWIRQTQVAKWGAVSDPLPQRETFSATPTPEEKNTPAPVAEPVVVAAEPVAAATQNEAETEVKVVAEAPAEVPVETETVAEAEAEVQIKEEPEAQVETQPEVETEVEAQAEAETQEGSEEQ